MHVLWLNNYCILVFRFYFPLFLSMLMYDNEMETEENEINFEV